MRGIIAPILFYKKNMVVTTLILQFCKTKHVQNILLTQYYDTTQRIVFFVFPWIWTWLNLFHIMITHLKLCPIVFYSNTICVWVHIPMPLFIYVLRSTTILLKYWDYWSIVRPQQTISSITEKFGLGTYCALLTILHSAVRMKT